MSIEFELLLVATKDPGLESTAHTPVVVKIVSWWSWIRTSNDHNEHPR